MANKGSGDVTVILLNDSPQQTSFSSAAAVARAVPTYTLKKNEPLQPSVHVYMNHSTNEGIQFSIADKMALNIQKCQALVVRILFKPLWSGWQLSYLSYFLHLYTQQDMPPNILTTDFYVQDVIDNCVEELNKGGRNHVSCTVIRG